ncbi:LacI family DNA-binding transcriptional regulator [Promicromonospora sp. Populi]|uniref:LacI family DNA-binding transcriptional regulator n=1 Tax=Promicromonospora sp. Populi TaxID=3239420 RepID=UPI0034E1C15D
MAKVGIADVAQAAGVSEATVSRVINNRGTVAAGTRKAVEAALRTVGYARTNVSNVVLLVTPGLDEPFFARTSERIMSALGMHGLRGVVCSAPVGGTQELDLVSAMVDAGIVATIFVSASNTLEGADPGVHRLLTREHIPFVCINGAFDQADAPVLSTNDALASQLAVEHLWGLGHRRIGLIAGPTGNRPSDRRVAGFRETMAALGAGTGDGTGDGTVDAAVYAPVVRIAYSMEGGVSAATTLLGAAEPPTAIIAASDEMALGAIRAARRAGLSIPGDLSVVGYDDALPLDFVDPPLTSVRQPVDRLAAAVAPIVLAQVRGRHPDATELMFDPELIVRASTAPAPR